MWIYEKKMEFPVKIKQTNPALAKIIISQYGGPYGFKLYKVLCNKGPYFSKDNEIQKNYFFYHKQFFQQWFLKLLLFLDYYVYLM